MASPLAAANAYASLARVADPSGWHSRAPRGRPGTKLCSAAQGRHRSVVESRAQVRCSDARCGQRQMNIVDVVTAVSETEVAVEALVSVRDR